MKTLCCVLFVLIIAFCSTSVFAGGCQARKMVEIKEETNKSGDVVYEVLYTCDGNKWHTEEEFLKLIPFIYFRNYDPSSHTHKERYRKDNDRNRYRYQPYRY